MKGLPHGVISMSLVDRSLCLGNMKGNIPPHGTAITLRCQVEAHLPSGAFDVVSLRWKMASYGILSDSVTGSL